MNQVKLFDITIDNVTLAEALERIESLIASGDKHFVTTPNVDHIVKMAKDREFLEAYRKASLVLPDGMPVIWASRLLGRPLKERVAGSDLILPLCRLAAEKDYSLYFLGGEPGVAERAVQTLKRSVASLSVVGSDAPPFGFESDEAENREIVRRINQARPDILFVGLGAPKQEKWTARFLDQLEVKVAVCCGASFDFIAGAARRAPEWMRPVGLEWLWRLLCEPGRLWKRYLLEDLAFLSIFFNEWRSHNP